MMSNECLLFQPPMPPAVFGNSRDSEHMSAMLMSWYMSGYYTGLYHGRKQAKEEIQAQCQSHYQGQSSSDKEAPNKKQKTKKCRNQ